jgi:hypothetical protein
MKEKPPYIKEAYTSTYSGGFVSYNYVYEPKSVQFISTTVTIESEEERELKQQISKIQTEIEFYDEH